MRKITFFSAVLSLFLLVPASIIWAQNISSQKGLTTALFTTAQGKIKVYLPDDIRSGDVISGRIIVEPLGNNKKQVEKNLAELKKYSISLNNEKFSVNNTNKSFRFLVQADWLMTGTMDLINVSSVIAAQLSIPAVSKNTRKSASDECMVPTHALTGSPLRITGPFDGNSSNTSCNLGNKPMVILAESPGQCILFYPADGGGVQKLEIKESAKQPCSSPVSGVNMNVSAGKLNLQKGENTYIDVSITGLQNLPETALLTLTNVTTGVVIMLPSNTIAIQLLPDSVGSGTFNRRFEVQSIRTGGFTVVVNLDLPETTDHLPTQPQPPDNPQPGDTTTHPPTVAQCPPCKCACTATVLFDGKDKDLFSYSVKVAASCSGSFGTPPCKQCGIVDVYKYSWTISYSADKPIDIIGGNKGMGFKFKNPSDGAFTLSVVVTITCSDGSTCTCIATTTYLPTTTTEAPGKCECNAVCYIKKKETGCSDVIFEADVISECKGVAVIKGRKMNCRVISVVYKWHIGESGKGVAGISGNASSKTVKVRKIKPGSYTIYLTVTVTCLDGTKCIYTCSKEETVADCIIDYEWCAGPSIKIKAMGYYPKDELLNDMRPGDLIGLSIYATDSDILLQKCISDRDIAITPHKPTPDQVNYGWSNENIRGTSGKLISSGGIGANSLLYQLPFCLTDYPVEDHVIVTLSNTSYKKDDVPIRVLFTIRLGATIEKIQKDGYNRQRELYKVTAVIEGAILDEPADIVCPAIKGCCQPILPPDTEEGAKLTVTEPIRFTLADDAFPDNMILLKAEATDNDNIVLKCLTTGNRIITKKIEGVYDDPEYTWKVVRGNARFIYPKGQSVVLIHNYYSKEPSNDLVIECRITDSRNDFQFIDPVPDPLHINRDARKKPVALVGIGDFEYRPLTLPTGIKGDNAEEAAKIVLNKYKNFGYQVKFDTDLDYNEIGTVLKDPTIQACFLIGHGGGGSLTTHDNKGFSGADVSLWTSDKWGCVRTPVVHPFIRDLNLLGCETGQGDWPKRFFRLEQYFAYGYIVNDCPIDQLSEIISRANKFIPLKLRIAPPE